MGWNHARVAHQAGELACVFDQDWGRSEAAAKAFGVAAAASVDEALHWQGVEAAVVATPTATHGSVALQALAAGRHVLVEKPIAPDTRTASGMVDAARDAGLCLAVGHVERHNPVVKYAQDGLEKRRFGDLLSLSAMRVSTFPGRVRDVGCIMDIGIHDIDVVCALAGAPVQNVFARAGTRRAAPHEDHAQVVLAFANGLSATLETNWLTPMRVRRLALTCTEAHVVLDYMDQVARISRAQLADPEARDLSSVPMEYSEQRVVLRRQEPLVLEHADFLESCRSRRPPLVPGKDGLRALAVAEAALASSRQGRAVAPALAHQPP